MKKKNHPRLFTVGDFSWLIVVFWLDGYSGHNIKLEFLYNRHVKSH